MYLSLLFLRSAALRSCGVWKRERCLHHIHVSHQHRNKCVVEGRERRQQLMWVEPACAAGRFQQLGRDAAARATVGTALESAHWWFASAQFERALAFTCVHIVKFLLCCSLTFLP